jgi:hypothetical protein
MAFSNNLINSTIFSPIALPKVFAEAGLDFA